MLDVPDIPQQGSQLEFPILKDETERYEIMKTRLHLERGGYICIHPGARDPRRRWSVENFAMLAAEIASRGLTPILTGSLK